jgi:hypothetical protein
MVFIGFHRELVSTGYSTNQNVEMLIKGVLLVYSAYNREFFSIYIFHAREERNLHDMCYGERN